MGKSEFYPLADQLIQLFERATGAGMPAHVVGLATDSTAGNGAKNVAGQPCWGRQPLVIFAIEEPVWIVMDGQDDINLKVGDALILTARDLTAMKPGGQGFIVAVESVSTQPCQFFIADSADPKNSRRYLEIFRTPSAESLPPCWEACNEIYRLLETAQSCAADPSTRAGPDMRSLLQLCATECHRALRAFTNEVKWRTEKSNTARMRAADAYISCNIGQDIRKIELADHIGVSVSQLTLTFREFGHLAVRDRLRFRRVELARNLLSDTDLSVSAVAERVGMNYRHFIRSFNQNAMLTPLRYRRYSRLSDKSAEIWMKLLYTAKFDQIEPLEVAFDVENQPDGTGSDSVSVLFSNSTSGAIRLSRRAADETFVEIGFVAAEKRLACLDHPGRIWKLQACDDKSDPVFFETAEGNSHFVFGSGRRWADN